MTPRHKMANFAIMTTPARQITSAELADQVRSVLDAAARGESTVITRWGLPVAIVAPFGDVPESAVSTSTPGDYSAPSLGLVDRFAPVTTRIAEAAHA